MTQQPLLTRYASEPRMHMRGFVLLMMVAFFAVPLHAADWSFRNDVQPVLMKAGCSTGACHGALAGQNGFRLSLRGYDDDGDYKSITRHALGRRINPYEPEKSLILLK